MIPGTGYYVTYTGTDRRRVVAFDEDGTPLIAARYGLAPASTVGDYWLEESWLAQIVPGGGWMATLTTEGGTEHTSPVVAWSIDSETGIGAPLVWTADGVVEEASHDARVWHPESTP